MAYPFFALRHRDGFSSALPHVVECPDWQHTYYSILFHVYILLANQRSAHTDYCVSYFCLPLAYRRGWGQEKQMQPAKTFCGHSRTRRECEHRPNCYCCSTQKAALACPTLRSTTAALASRWRMHAIRDFLVPVVVPSIAWLVLEWPCKAKARPSPGITQSILVFLQRLGNGRKWSRLLAFVSIAARHRA